MHPYQHSVVTPKAAEGCDMLIERTTESEAIATALLKKFLLSARPDVVSFYFVKSGSRLEPRKRASDQEFCHGGVRLGIGEVSIRARPCPDPAIGLQLYAGTAIATGQS
jgi:hypothetical protein